MKDLLRECVRCGAVPLLTLDMGKLGRVGLCSVCWIGLAGAMARDFTIFNDFHVDFVAEISKAREREEFVKTKKIINE